MIHIISERPSRERVLTGNNVVLKPLDVARDIDELWDCVRDKDQLFTHLKHGPFSSKAEYADNLNFLQQEKDAIHYIGVDIRTNRIIGFVLYRDISMVHNSIQVGGGWILPEFQGGYVFIEAMFLMINNAFELNFNRVEGIVMSRNERMKAAITKLGFVLEGCKRRVHMKGDVDDMLCYSLLPDEWKSIKPQVQHLCGKKTPAAKL